MVTRSLFWIRVPRRRDRYTAYTQRGFSKTGYPMGVLSAFDIAVSNEIRDIVASGYDPGIYFGN